MIQRNDGKERASDWMVFDDWGPVPTVNKVAEDWSAFDKILLAFEDVSKVFRSRLEELIEKWNPMLEQFGRDPTPQNWRRFRPLGLDREEDWSDWLAHLIES